MSSPGTTAEPRSKSILVTGCSQGGIGHALARAFHAKGLHVFATARDQESLADLKGIGIEVLSLEVTSAASVLAAKEQVQQSTGGSLDYLVNNAGRNYTVPALDIDFDEVRTTFETNVFAVMRLCKEFSPLLIQAKGTIVNIGSIAGKIPYVFGSVYNATKAALHAYSDTLRVELAPFDVKVMVVVTGGVKSNIARTHRELPKGSLYVPLLTEYERRLKHSQEGSTDTMVFAESVAREVLRTAPPRSIWRGHQSWNVWLLLQIMPSSFWDFYFSTAFRFDKLVKFVRAQKRDG